MSNMEDELNKLESAANEIAMNSKAATASASAKATANTAPQAVDVGGQYMGSQGENYLVSKVPNEPIINPEAIVGTANPVLMDIDKIKQQDKRMFEQRRRIEELGCLDWGDLARESLNDPNRNDAYKAARVLEDHQRFSGSSGGRNMRQATVPNVIPVGTGQVSPQQLPYGDDMQDGWIVEEKTKFTNSGRQSSTFYVVDAVSGMTTGRGYLMEEVAEKIARVLNHSNDPNDSRVTMIDECYSRFVALAKKKLQCQKMGKNTQSLDNAISEVKTQLGLD